MRHLPTQRESARPELAFWLPTFAGVLVLIAVLVFTLTRVTAPEPTARPLPDPIAPFQPLTPASFLPLPATAGPGSAPASVRGSVVPSGSGGEGTAPGPTDSAPTARPSPTPSRTVRPPTPTVFGTYRVLDSYGDAFIGEVLISNTSGQDQNWTVSLRFPSNVGQLSTSWVEGAPQATLSRSGATDTWRSGVPVPRGSSVPLRFRFSRSGTGNFPTTCTTNGTACTIS